MAVSSADSFDLDKDRLDLGPITIPGHVPETMQSLIRELRSAGHCRRTRSDSISSPRADLDCVIHTLTAVLDFVAQTLPPEQDADMRVLARSIAVFGSALTDLQNGREHEIFKCAKKKGGGAPPTASEMALFRATAARALELLIEGGTPLKTAAKRVADAVNARRRGPRITAGQVEKWREGFRAGDRGLRQDFGLARFRAPLPPEAGKTPTKQASWILQHFKGQIA